MATKAEIRQRVAEDLGLVPIGQTVESQDQARIDATFDEVYATLKDKGLAIFTSTGPVPARLVPSLCLLMSVKLLTSYSVPESRYVRITTEAGPDGSLATQVFAGLAKDTYVADSSVEDF